MTARSRLRSAFDAAAAERGFRLAPQQVPVADALAELGSRRRARGGGLYLHGPVGRGKSFLVDVFFTAAPTRNKLRVHFHQFFDRLHRLTAARIKEGTPNATGRALDELLAGCRLVCFDEFHVHDPGDAALITRLLRELLARRVTLVTTSNYRPVDLLPNPIHHHLFEPAIELIERNLRILELTGHEDFRTAGGTGQRFATGTWGAIEIPTPQPEERTALRIGDRTLRTSAVRDELVWFDFHDLCGTATSTRDYLALAERFGTWVLGGVPVLADCDEQARRRFADLVDVLCDRDIALHVAAERTVAETLTDDRDFARTASRLAQLKELGHPPAPPVGTSS